MRYHFEKNFRTQHKQRAENLKNIYRLNKIPSDTQLRDVLDKVDHLQYRQIFKKLFSFLQRAKTLELFEFIKLNNNPYYLMAVDGTGYFRSEKIKCDYCIMSEHTNEHGEITLKYGHNMLGASIVNPKQAQVIPFYPEAIIKQDGTSKNDCEQNSFRRFLKNFKKRSSKIKNYLYFRCAVREWTSHQASSRAWL